MTEESEDGTVKKTKKVSAASVDAFLDILLSVLADVLRKKSGVSDLRNTDCREIETILDSTFTISQIQGMIQVAVDAKEMLFYKANPLSPFLNL